MGRQRDKNATQMRSLATFRRFKEFPAEIQQQIFIEAMDLPYFHTVIVKRVDNRVTGTWSLSFYPDDPKSRDRSGHRLYEKMASVDPAAAAAMRYERQTRLGQLPFKKLRAPVDYERDLVVLDFRKCKGRTLGYLHPDNQILNPTGSAFDANAVAMQLEKIQKVAVVWNDQQPLCHDSSNNFRCPDPSSPVHEPHRNWCMCPEELFGLLNCFPELRQFYLLIPLGKKTNPQQLHVEDLIEDTYKFNDQHLYPVFHGRGRSFVHAGQLRSWEGRNHESNDNELSVFQLSPHRVHPSMLEMLRELRDDSFLADDVETLPEAERVELSQKYRLSRKERENLVFGVLLQCKT
ncbi:hypothetical protein MYCTH_96059 [Thermothelomyces thermophilus ATCC 42464]|uniref:Uncharacterized protein n=1 Tax=Thermothelomyces thermophilus (strain ATCC 42464 / BCRC 31852 / DSM 1799) TaxID=573729 RepID=G2QJP1_THET4|nr:uncharacterized protein MYCTH_96059 [Thermothelomyces thermophilus ATCC 42464]AEO59798.1 hypothetical protein MYCTH_96059 [Thermothelomyces thermophilus ATCC 42464]